MARFRWQSYNVGPVIFAIILAIIGLAVPSVRLILLLIALIVALWVGFMNFRNRQMDPEHAKWLQKIAVSVHDSLESNDGHLNFSDGTRDLTINRTCFRSDFSELVPLLDEWQSLPHLLVQARDTTKEVIRTSAYELWPDLRPSTLFEYAVEYTTKNISSQMPSGPWFAVMPTDSPSQLLQMTSRSSGKVIRDYGGILYGEHLDEALDQMLALQGWVVSMFRSPQAHEWRRVLARRAELRNELRENLQKLSIRPTLKRGKCDVCTDN